jgi:hypothetical protein
MSTDLNRAATVSAVKEFGGFFRYFGLAMLTLLGPLLTESWWFFWPLAAIVALGLAVLQRNYVLVLAERSKWVGRTFFGAVVGLLVGFGAITINTRCAPLTSLTPRVNEALMGGAFGLGMATAQWMCVRRQRSGRQLVGWLLLAYSIAAFSFLLPSVTLLLIPYLAIVVIYIWPIRALIL